MGRICFITILSFLVPLPAFAEYCDMVGATGEVKWLYIPRSQYLPTEKTLRLGNRTYDVDSTARLFQRAGLPDVNATVVLQHNVSSTILPDCLSQSSCPKAELERQKIIEDIDKKSPYIFNEHTTSINTDAYYCTSSGGKNGCWDLPQGAKLKVIGYTTINQVLYALVQVNEC